MIDVIILCGGFGSRISNYSKETPKLLLNIEGEPLIYKYLHILRNIPFRRLIFATHHLSHKIEEELKKIYLENIVIEKELFPLGTGGAVKNIVRKFSPMTPVTAVLNGDIYCDIDLYDMYSSFEDDFDCLMMSTLSRNPGEYGSIVTQGNKIIKFSEKRPSNQSSWINAGFYLFSSSYFDNFPSKDVFSLEYDVFPFINKLMVYKYSGIWYDLGTPARYLKAFNHADYLSNQT